MRFAETPELPEPFTVFTLRSLFLAVVLTGITLGHYGSLVQSPELIEACTAGSLLIAVVLTVFITFCTTKSPRFHVRKLVSFAAASIAFVLCHYLICVLRRSDAAFDASGAWAPLPPQLISLPIQFLALIAALGAGWCCLFLANVSESVDTVDRSSGDA